MKTAAWETSDNITSSEAVFQLDHKWITIIVHWTVLQRSTTMPTPSTSHLYQHVGGIVETHDQCSHSRHVVHVWQRDEGDRRHVVEEHDQEILRRRKGK